MADKVSFGKPVPHLWVGFAKGSSGANWINPKVNGSQEPAGGSRIMPAETAPETHHWKIP